MNKKAGLYIHIPFCRSKCPYCDFYSIASLSLAPLFMDALKKEIAYYKDHFGFKCFDTVYIGGGTPTALKEEHIGALIRHVFENMNISHNPEITIEANPCDITVEKAHSLKSMGINRISLGIQSFNGNILRFLGRRHAPKDAIAAFESLRGAGFENIGIDLIYAIPGQDLSDWMDTLKMAVSLFPEHISCYELTFEKKTPFWKKLKKGEILEVDEYTKRRFFIETSSFLESKGYIHYEISNFAKGREHFSRHNQKYWLHIPYLGLGPSAHSFDGKRRWWNFSSVKKYCDTIQKGTLPVEGLEELTEEQVRMERIFLGLRTCYGIEKNAISNVPENILLMLQRNDLLKIEDDRIIPTKKGFSVSDQLSSYLI